MAKDGRACEDEGSEEGVGSGVNRGWASYVFKRPDLCRTWIVSFSNLTNLSLCVIRREIDSPRDAAVMYPYQGDGIPSA